MVSFTLIFVGIILGITILISILIYKKNNKKNIYVNNILLHIGLIIFSGIIYLIYDKLFNYIGIRQWGLIFTGIIIILGIWFYNFVGIILSIIRITKIHLSIIAYSLLIISTILTYNVVNNIGKILEDNKFITECSSILLIGIIMIIENIFSYIIVKIMIGINNKVRSNCS